MISTKKIIPLLAVLFIAVFGLASCEKEEVVKTTNNVAATDKIDNATHTPVDINNAPYQKEITTKGIGASRAYDFTFKITSNDANLLRAFDNSSVTFEFLSKEAVAESMQNISTADTQSETASATTAIDKNAANGNTFVSVTLTKITSPISLAELPPYDLRLSEQVLDVIRKAKAQTVFDLGEIQVYTTDNSRACNPCTIWNNNKIVKIVADCGSVGTRTDNYWANAGSSTLYYLSTSNYNNVANNFTGFKCNSVISSCCVAGDKWVRRVYVLQDVVVGLQGLNNACVWGSWCGPSSNSNCSGLYSGGCY
jgi:hypothetical protein